MNFININKIFLVANYPIESNWASIIWIIFECGFAQESKLARCLSFPVENF